MMPAPVTAFCANEREPSVIPAPTAVITPRIFRRGLGRVIFVCTVSLSADERSAAVICWLGTMSTAAIRPVR